MKPKCIMCATSLPVDKSTTEITCPKCGTEFTVTQLKGVSYEGLEYWIEYKEQHEPDPTNN